MRIAVVTTQVPFVRGGSETLAEGLINRLRLFGHEAELIRIPFQWSPSEQILNSIMACRLIRVDPLEPDLVIGLKFPAYLTPFPQKKVWLLHQFRQAYDLWGTQYQDLPSSPEGEAIRDIVIGADNRYLKEAKKIYTISKNVADRLRRHNHMKADGVLYPPHLQPEIFHAGEYGNYFFYPSRLVEGKRQMLAIQAMKHVKSNFKLVLAGKADTDTYFTELQKTVEKLNLGDKVKLLGWVSEEQKADLLANAYACINIPYDEDYGYVTLEAFYAHKPTITCTDSGAPNEFIRNNHNGMVVEPTPESLASCMEQLWTQRKRVAAMGEAGFQTLSEHKISWEHVVEKLVS
jgi:glycosyltransferase involved in cell wall biosynthesis